MVVPIASNDIYAKLAVSNFWNLYLHLSCLLLRLDINAETFLTEVSHYPLQVKLAFVDKVPVTKLSAALQIICGETANAVIKKLKLGGNFTKFLQSCTLFTVEKAGSNTEVSLSENSFPEIM
jgi:hypothetical protein